TATAEVEKAEIATAWDALRKIDRELRDRTAEMEALERAREVLCDKLSEAKQRVLEGETANAALRAEKTSLKDQLAVVREVGGAAIAALKSQPAVAPELLSGNVRLAQMPGFFRPRTRPRSTSPS